MDSTYSPLPEALELHPQPQQRATGSVQPNHPTSRAQRGAPANAEHSEPS